MEKGLRWRIGDGRTVYIWKDKWIPNDTGGKTLSIRPTNCTLTMVHELLDHHRKCCKRQLVEQLFQPQEVPLILQTPIYQQVNRDKLVWSLEKNGIFSVKSAYRLAYLIRKENNSETESNRTRDENGRMWKQVWKMPVMPKLKHFLLRVIHNWLATGLVIKDR